VAPGVAVTDGVAERQTAGTALGGKRLRDLQHSVKIGRPGIETGLLQDRDPVHDPSASGSEWNGNPFAVVHAEFPTHVVPSAILLIEIFADIGDIDQFIRILMGIVVPRIDDVRAFADICGNRSLRTQVLPGLVLHLDLDPGLLRVFFSVLQPKFLVASDEFGRPKNAQRCAFFRLQIELRFLCADRQSETKASRRTGERCRTEFQ
jgi:hypothetical protein